MAISSETRAVTYNGDGATTEFSFPHPFFAQTDIYVSLITVATSAITVLTRGVDYTVATTGNTFRDGGYITTTATYANTHQIKIERIVDYKQEVVYNKYDAFPAKFHEDALDKLTMMAQQIKDLSAVAPVGTRVEQGCVWYYDGTDWNVLLPGTAGHFFMTNGVGANPGWVAAPTAEMLKAVYDPASVAEQLVGLAATQTLTNKTLTTPIIGALYQDAGKTHLLTFPAATTVIVGRSTTDTLTNKTLTTPVCASMYQDAGKTLLVTLPAATTLLVGRDTTDTLTNKTLTAPVLGGVVTGTYTIGGTPTFPANVVLSAAAQVLTNKTLTNAVLNGTATGTAILDEGSLSSNSATHLATQRSIKAYVDTSSPVAGPEASLVMMLGWMCK